MKSSNCFKTITRKLSLYLEFERLWGAMHKGICAVPIGKPTGKILAKGSKTLAKRGKTLARGYKCQTLNETLSRQQLYISSVHVQIV